MTKEKGSSTPEESPKSDNPILEPIWTSRKVQERKEIWVKELQEASPEKREKLIMDGFATLMARQCQHLEAINTQDRAIGSLQEQINFLKKGYDELCLLHDQWKKTIWEITVRQKDFIEEVKNALRLVKMRLTKAGL